MAPEDALAWLTLAHLPGLDPSRLAALIDELGSAHALLSASPSVFERHGISEVTRLALSAAAPPSRAQARWLEQPLHQLLPCTDARYPAALTERPDRPRVLYVCGSLEALGAPQLAIVGSRNPTPQGREIAYEFAASLALRGMAVTSGLAEGIDTAAHLGALSAQGSTLAVLASGLDTVYPASNATLAEKIGRSGALVSEFPLGAPPRRAHFAWRNRLIASLTRGTLVVEAARRSGSLITARAARTRGRPVFAVPGSIRNPLSRGCHELIRAGAELVEGVDDILNALHFSPLFGACMSPEARSAATGSPATGMDKGHEILLDAVGFEAVDIDTLVVRTGFKAEAVSSMMLILELEGHVQAAPGGRYSRANRRAGGERERSRSTHLSVRELHERR